MAEPYLSEVFADHISRVTWDDLCEGARERARQSTLDTIGVIIGALELEPSTRPVLEMMAGFGGTPDCSILGKAEKLPPLSAAFVNGALAHSLDFDDHAPEGHHPSSSIIPVCLALAQRQGGVSGRDFLTAVAVGQDLFMRIRRNVDWKHDWHLTTVIAVFTAVASAAHLLKMTRAQTVSAFGIAGAQAAGTYELVQGVNNQLRGFYAGFVSHQAMLSVLMAQCGVSGPSSIFEGKTGFFNVYFDGQWSREGVLKDLGEVFQGRDLAYKPWPSCGLSHSYIWAAQLIRRAKTFAPEEIAQIRVHAGPGQLELCAPLEMRIAPKTAADAKFSIPYCVALTLLNGSVTPQDFLPENLNAPGLREIGEKMKIISDPSKAWNGTLPPGRVEVELTSGEIIAFDGTAVPGSAEVPMTWDEIIEKYYPLMRSAGTLSEARIERSVTLIRALEEVADMRDLLAEVCPA